MLAGKDGAHVSKWLADYEPVDGKATAYVCENYACKQPVTEVEGLKRMLSGNTITK